MVRPTCVGCYEFWKTFSKIKISMQISAPELAKLLQSATPPRLLDVREVDENRFAVIPGSVLIPLGELPNRIEEILPWQDEPMVVYCHHGVRSQRAINLLRQVGFTKLQNLSGGIEAWSNEVDPKVPRY